MVLHLDADFGFDDGPGALAIQETAERGHVDAWDAVINVGRRSSMVVTTRSRRGLLSGLPVVNLKCSRTSGCRTERSAETRGC